MAATVGRFIVRFTTPGIHSRVQYSNETAKRSALERPRSIRLGQLLILRCAPREAKRQDIHATTYQLTMTKHQIHCLASLKGLFGLISISADSMFLSGHRDAHFNLW